MSIMKKLCIDSFFGTKINILFPFFFRNILKIPQVATMTATDYLHSHWILTHPITRPLRCVSTWDCMYAPLHEQGLNATFLHFSILLHFYNYPKRKSNSNKANQSHAIPCILPAGTVLVCFPTLLLLPLACPPPSRYLLTYQKHFGYFHQWYSWDLSRFH